LLAAGTPGIWRERGVEGKEVKGYGGMAR